MQGSTLLGSGMQELQETLQIPLRRSFALVNGTRRANEFMYLICPMSVYQQLQMDWLVEENGSQNKMLTDTPAVLNRWGLMASRCVPVSVSGEGCKPGAPAAPLTLTAYDGKTCQERRSGTGGSTHLVLGQWKAHAEKVPDCKHGFYWPGTSVSGTHGLAWTCAQSLAGLSSPRML